MSRSVNGFRTVRRGRTLEFDVEVQPESRFFEGHFPGRPVLPAVAHLALVEALLAASHGEDARLAALESARFRGSVLPGDVLSVALAEPEPGSLRWTARRGGEPICNGLGSIGRRAGAARLSAGERTEPAAPAESSYLPHRAPAAFVQRIESHDERESTCTALVPLESPFVRAIDGVPAFPSYLAAELGVQCAAAAEARARAVCEPGVVPAAGLVVRIGSVELDRLDLPAGVPLRVHAALESAAPPLRVWRCTLLHEGVRAAAAVVSTFA